ncbi:hypothetical protein QNI16_27110 [Cytophagaceae bacterium YF14B1]|uniref:YD repeat-containing protein n=1 Tax=Xanthocytophaga flava TaxID=3048013 RepID=A0AAE3QVK2_9BACT|nr:hypothetical protein [Xanthocytophaga flavus]MDJ1484198.1 hypothetical protein [Xanthocytophaga flavus]
MIKILHLLLPIRIKQWGLFVMTLLYSVLVQAQKASSSLPTVVPPSPNAASLGVFGNVPISLYTGLPNVTIPIYTIQYRDITLPISLSYHGQGVKVDQEASWVGLNWALMAGGTITRTIRGYDDILHYNLRRGYPYLTDEILSQPGWGVPPEDAPGSDFYNQDVADYEPDIFYYNIGGQSGKFILDKITSPPAGQKITIKGIPLDAQKISITYYSNSTSTVPDNLPGYWEIITADGMKYRFETKEFTFTRRSSGVWYGAADADNNCVSNMSNGELYGNRSPDALQEYHIDNIDPTLNCKQVGAWQLDQISSPTGATVEFIYDMTTNYASLSPLMRDERNGGGFDVISGNGTETTTSQLITKERLLKEIHFGDGKIEFITENRADIGYLGTFTIPSGYTFTPSVPQRLKQIKITATNRTLNLANTVFNKVFELKYGYFNQGKAQEYLRLKLTEVIENTEKRHQFFYDERMPLPSKNSFDKDHWGYYNGPWNNYSNTLTQIPLMRYQAPNSGSATILNPSRRGADVFTIRSVDQGVTDSDGKKDYPYMKAGILTKIIYPTGGSTSFNFEPNTYELRPELVSESDDSYEMKIITAGNNHKFDANGNLLASDMSEIFEVSQITNVKFSVTNGSAVFLKAYARPNDLISIYPVNADGTLGATPIYTSSGTGCLGQVQNPGQSNPYDCISETYTSPGYDFTIYPGRYRIVFKNIFVRTPLYENPKTGIEVLNVYFKISFPNFSSATARIGGGLRIRQTVDSDGINPSKDIVRNYNYNYTDGIEKSSGKLMSNVIKYLFPTNFIDDNNTRIIGYVIRSSTTYPLSSSAQGSSVGYSKVSVSIGQNDEAGREVYYYYNEPELIRYPTAKNNCIYLPDRPFNEDKNMNGFLQEKDVFEKKNNQLRLIQKEESSFNTIILKTVKSYYFWGTWKSSTMTFRWQNSTTQTQTAVSYDAQGNAHPVVSVSRSFSDNPLHYLPTRSETTGSDGKTLVSITTYPEDYPAGTPFIDGMKTSFLHALPIESVSYQVNADNTTSILSGQITTYQTACSICKDQTFLLETASPVALANFKFSNRTIGQLPFGNTTATGFAIDDKYKSRISYSYDSFANIRQLSKPSDIPLIYLWGYGHQYPVAEIKNATYQQVLNAIGGQSVVNDIAQSPTIDDYLDDLAKLRTIPKAMVSTYTYLPLVGVKTVSGVDGKTLTYEYDSLQRLRVIRDQKGYIVKQYRYHYQGQPALE